ncbi:alpha/beta hydrolase [Actinoplanes couchii]|uniref:DUF1023 domain-containing protein n=2 Tax=Actinoplanes couchii TaxID=403638 RepID=A0ABQ3XG57_9ACTN|nr:hypothetical protein Aco03nite_058090 [Actinoplanes couchii]
MATTLAGLSIVGGSALGPSLPTLPGTAALALFGPAQSARAMVAPGIHDWLADTASPPDPRSATVQEVADFFTHVSAIDSTRLAHRFPEIVGNLDGAPTTLRYTANRSRRPQLAGRQILAFDDRGDGRIVETMGDLDNADRVIVLVPGVSTGLANFDTGLGGIQRRALAWQARQLFEQARTVDRTARVAVVAWLGYNPPEGMGQEVVREDRAVSGAADLVRFVDALVLGHAERSVVVVGHSYGSTVAGLAAAHLSGQVTDVVALGSPGMGVDGIAGLHTAARVWACASPDDWIRRVPGVRVLGLGHGRLPFDPDFGALPLPCNDVEGHDGYFVPGTSSLRALAAIATNSEETDPR